MKQSSTHIQRQWQIVIAMMSRRGGVTVKELASEVGVDVRTIHRDLKTLRAAQFPLEERTSEHGRKHWKLAEGGTHVPIQFTWPEAVSLYLGRRLLDPLAGTNFWQSAHSAFGKIRATLGEAALLQLDKVSRSFLQTMPGISDYSSKADLIDSLMLAIEDHKIAFVAYQSERATEPVTLELYPYGIVYHRGSLYLIAYSRDHETRSQQTNEKQEAVADLVTDPTSPSPQGTRLSFSAKTVADLVTDPTSPRPQGTRPPFSAKTVADLVTDPTSPSPRGTRPPFSAATPPVPGDESGNSLRHFKIDRVTDVEVTTLQFSLDPNFHLQKHLANSFGIFQGGDRPDHLQKIRIRFSSEAARYVQEKTWHPSQTLHREKDGSVILEVSLNNTTEIKSWTLSFGPRATVLEPASLRNEIIADLKTLLNKYQPNQKAKK